MPDPALTRACFVHGNQSNPGVEVDSTSGIHVRRNPILASLLSIYVQGQGGLIC